MPYMWQQNELLNVEWQTFSPFSLFLHIVLFCVVAIKGPIHEITTKGKKIA
jgi:hypothetical protein